MFDHSHYVPILKWRQGEYQALFRLDAAIKTQITPLFEIPTENWDFENNAPQKSLDEHLESFGKRLKAKWGSRICFVDSCHLNGNATVLDDLHHFEWIFSLARMEGAQPIPVTGIDRSAAYQAATQKIIAADKRGVCLRLKAADFDKPDLAVTLKTLMALMKVKPKEVDVLIDLAEDLSESFNLQAKTWLALIQQLPLLDSWRTVTIAGTSFPQSLPSATFRPHGVVNRTEWRAYKKLINLLPEDMRIPTFGDYAVSHPKTEKLDPRLIDPLAKIKYTIHDQWFIVMGKTVKKNGRSQYKQLCQSILKAEPTIFAGATFSWGDNYIHGCANGTEGTGGSSTWPCAGTNHHITQMVGDISSFHGPSTVAGLAA